MQVLVRIPIDPESMDAVVAALDAEESLGGVEANVAREDGAVLLSIRGDDLSSTRAALNSYMHWIDEAIKVSNIGKCEK